MFYKNSRYAQVETYQVKDRRGRIVTVVAPARAPLQDLAGYHRLIQGQRPDHLAFQYLKDAKAYWRLAEANDVMLAESLSEKPEIAIPQQFQSP